MRMRRKPWARPELAACDFFVDSPKLNRGKWAECFKKQQPLHLELGCGFEPVASMVAFYC